MRTRGYFVLATLGLFLGSAGGCATATTVVDEEDGGPEPAPIDASTAKDTSAPKPDSAKADTAPPPVQDSASPDTSPTPTDSGPDAAALAPRPGEAFDPAAPKPGDPCPTGVNVNDLVTRRCGKCGEQKALCETGRVVGAYGACAGEKTNADACLPRERLLSDCGFCGKQTKDCDSSCSYVEGACQNQVAGGCTANEVSYIEGVCPTAGDVRRTVCSAACVKGAPEACAPRPLDEIVVSQTPGTTVTAEIPVYGTKVATLSEGPCPRTLTSTLTSYQYVRVKNTGADSVTVTISNGVTGGSTPDTIVALYPGPNAPADRTQCTGSVNDDPESFVVAIPAGGSVIFQQSLYSAAASTAKLRTNVKTNFVGAEVAPVADHTLNVAAVGAVATQAIAFDAAKMIPLPNSPPGFDDPAVCPLSLSADDRPYRYVRVQNTGAAARTVTLETVGSTDTIVAYYSGNAPISTARNACTGSYSDDASGLNGRIPGVVIPAGGAVTVYVGKYSAGAGATTFQATTTL